MAKYTISKTKLERILKENIQKVINHDLINPLNEESTFLDNPPFIITEGLIQTYPIDRAISAFANVYKLQMTKDRKEFFSVTQNAVKNNDNDFNGAICKESSLNETERIIMILGDSVYNKQIAEHYMDKYGYVLTTDIPYYQGWRMFVFEKKFDNDATEIVRNVGYVYHICKMSLKDKILKQGLTPRKSQWKTFNNGPRCYFFLPLSLEQLERIVMDFKLSKKEYDEEYMLLKVNIEKLPHDTKFYSDPRIKNGVYTLEGIPPTAIEIIKEHINGSL